MKKSNFITLILGVIGTVCFSLGMCMTLLPEWGMGRPGIICGVAGLAILLADLFYWRRAEGKAPIHISGKTLGTVAVAVLGALLLGVGMCLCMVFAHMVAGVIVGLVGILTLIMLIPLIKGLKD